MHRLSDFDYEVRQELIAQQPIRERSGARLMVVGKNGGQVEHRRFRQITDYLRCGDLMVFNDTKVLPARLIGQKESGGRVEILMLDEVSPYTWNVLIKTSGRPGAGIEVRFGAPAIIGRLHDTPHNGHGIMSFSNDGKEFKTQKEFMDCLERVGIPPLPPYIKRKQDNGINHIADRERYQTVFARKSGAIAAPTAGLHFTPALLEQIAGMGVEIVFVTLHVGAGTFSPVKEEDYRRHVMHSEYFEVSEAAANTIRSARRDGRRIIGVGTTSCRVLETIGGSDDTERCCSGRTNIFIYPPYQFKMTDVLITNFHQPRTTLLLLVSAFAGRENILNAYRIAEDSGYRFFSYGDCMMIM